MLKSGAPSIRLKALSMPLSSTTAITIAAPISLAFASAALIASRAASVLIVRLTILVSTADSPSQIQPMLALGHRDGQRNGRSDREHPARHGMADNLGQPTRHVN